MEIYGGLSEQVLDKVEDRLDNKYGSSIETDKLNELDKVISGMESDYGKNLYNPDSTAKGIYQFTDDSFETAKNRLSKIIGYLPDRINEAQTVNDLSSDAQKALFFAHLSEDKGSDERMIEYINQGTSGAELYVQDHYKGQPTPETGARMNQFFGPGSDRIKYYLED